MPRRANNQQKPAAAPGQAYGENQDQIQAQNIIPLTDNTVPPAQSHQAGAGTGGDSAGNPPAGGLAAALAAATGMTPPPPGGLAAPSSRPDEHITTGLNTPVAKGPSRAKAQAVSDYFNMMAEVTGNPMYRELAATAAQQGA